jgi:Kef-type K+ transport system membrane component KefB
MARSCCDQSSLGVSLFLFIGGKNPSPKRLVARLLERKYLLLLCMVFFIAFIFEAGFTYVLWSSKRSFDKIEREEL